MSEKQASSKKSLSPDWFVQGILSRIGDTFDRLMGRGWKPSSSLATSELIEKVKRLLDSEVRESEDGRGFVPHNITLKMQWDKFSTDAEDWLKALETELLTAVVDHINDKRYYTYAPIKLEVKPDYFTSGVKLFVAFERSGDVENEAEMDVAVPGSAAADVLPNEINKAPASEKVTVQFEVNGQSNQRILRFSDGKRLSVGRTKENNLTIDDPSVSKMHASLMLNSERRIVVADTGSTNGTFVGGERISYGKAVTLGNGEKLKFGSVEVEFEILKATVEISVPVEPIKADKYTVGGMDFTNKTMKIPAAEPTVSAKIAVDDPFSESMTNVDAEPGEQNIEFGLADGEKVETK